MIKFQIPHCNKPLKRFERSVNKYLQLFEKAIKKLHLIIKDIQTVKNKHIDLPFPTTYLYEGGFCSHTSTKTTH